MPRKNALGPPCTVKGVLKMRTAIKLPYTLFEHDAGEESAEQNSFIFEHFDMITVTSHRRPRVSDHSLAAALRVVGQ